mmetsp:Transcript_41951/g.87681  ORF Transcript_41951/g.87681 Transcript_41951/m.87681 type:complete len:204 (+) Transcript_41951:1497-2108(+)
MRLERFFHLVSLAVSPTNMVVATTAAPATFCAAPQAGQDRNVANLPCSEGSRTATEALQPCQSAASKKTPPEESVVAAQAAVQATATIPVLQLSASHCFSPPPLPSPPATAAEAGTLQIAADGVYRTRECSHILAEADALFPKVEASMDDSNGRHARERSPPPARPKMCARRTKSALLGLHCLLDQEHDSEKEELGKRKRKNL